MKLLLVDDHALFCEALQSLLTLHGYEVVGTAGDGMEALEEARRLHPDLILMDIEMPDCDGLAATRLIKAEMPDTKIVMLTVAQQDEVLFESLKSGASGYLLKSSRASQLLLHLGQLAEGQAALSPGLAEKILDEFARMGRQLESNSEQVEETADLTARQREILTLIVQGMTYEEMGKTLCLSERTIRYHMEEIIQQLQLENRSQVIAYAARMGLTWEHTKRTE
jgi:two-component system NarL family response regulator